MVGRVSGRTLLALADLAESHGSARVRLTPHQKLLVLDVEASRVEPLVEALQGIGLEARPSLFRRNTMACTGIEYCKLAIVETKGLAAKTVATLEQRLADIITAIDVPVTLNINGCPNSCARIQTADIGLKGQLLGGDEFGFQVHLGGGFASAQREAAGLGQTIRGLRVTAVDLADYVERVTRRYLSDRTDGESFAAWVAHTPEDALR